ncbi:MAG: putative fatty-acid--CoA ligase, partial [Polaromonas sp.]|nr:putative fatty-acid--CoA ligase [Polaromonas sp.]
MTPALLKSPTVWGLLARRAGESPDAPLVIDGFSGMRLNCSEVLRAAERLASALLALGVQPGSVLTWQLPTGLSAFVLQLALARLGVVQNPMISLYGPAEVEMVLRRNRSDFYLVPQDGVQGLEGRAHGVLERLPEGPQFIVLPQELPQGDPATLPPPPEAGDQVRWIYLTSGTTAELKGARHTDESLLLAGLNLAQAAQAGPGDVGTIAFPIAHVGGMMNTVMLLASGASAVLLPRYQPAEAVAIFARHGVTVTGGSTAHYQALLAEQRR